MSEAMSYPRGSPIRYGWLRAMYAANILISGPIGVGALLAPEAFRTLMGLPPQDPIHFGIASGAVPLAFGLAGLRGAVFPVEGRNGPSPSGLL